jgi:hypothetical protein
MHLVPKSPETKQIVKEAFLSISKCWPVLGPGPDFKTQPDMFKGVKTCHKKQSSTNDFFSIL